MKKEDYNLNDTNKNPSFSLPKENQKGKTNLENKELKEVTIRFAGDSGDGMQLTGERFTTTSAIMGEEVATVTDFPSEIRAPAGTLAGVSGFQLTFGSDEVYSSTDQVDTLVVMNPAALKVNLSFLKDNGILIANNNAFTPDNLKKANFNENPLEKGLGKSYQVFSVPITHLTKEALKDLSLTSKEMERCKNFFALGLSFWLYERKMDLTFNWLDKKFAKKPILAQANKLALQGGWNYGESTELFATRYKIKKSNLSKKPGTYRHVTGNKAVSLGLVLASKKAELPLYLASYPITPATEILQELSQLKNYGITTYQAEDEIAAIGFALGSSFGGSLSITSTSGPGLCLKSEFINLAVMAELPLVIINVQRGGPSTGLPTKTEQTDLFQALWGRNGESPIVVIAARSPSDCFNTAYLACKIATKYMTPVILLSDNYLANGSEVWKVPEMNDLPEFEVKINKKPIENFQPFLRDKTTLARPWVVPGTKGGEHRIGGLEKEDITGNISYEAKNHEKMVILREQKIENVCQEIPPTKIYGNQKSDFLVIGWGSTYGILRRTIEKLNNSDNLKIAFIHLRFLNPLPSDLKDITKNFNKVMIIENNRGQLWKILSAHLSRPLEKFSKVEGLPLKNIEIEEAIKSIYWRKYHA